MKRAGILAALALAAPTTVSAQDNRGILPPGQVRVMVAKYGACMVRVRHDRVRDALRVWSEGQGDGWLPVSRDCAMSPAFETTEMRFPPEAYRYAMAEALYAADHGNAALTDVSAAPLRAPPEISPAREGDARAQAAHDFAVAERYRLIVADCVVRSAPAETHALLTSQVETKAELAAIAAVQPALAQCLPKNQTARFNRSSLRGVLALAALRLDALANSPIPARDGTH